MEKIVECIPNFSEGRQTANIERIAGAFRDKKELKLLDYSADPDHNRMVITAMGSPDAIKEALINAVGFALDSIDLNCHQGGHPRIGAADVIPFVPIRGMSKEDCVALSKDCACALAEKYDLPIFLYEHSATALHRRNLADLRKGGFEGLTEKMQDKRWEPDFGPKRPHPTGGASVVGARDPLIAYNVNLNSSRIEIAQAIARKIRHIGGGLRCCKAIGVELKEQGIVQVSTNITDYRKTSIYQVLELVRIEAARYGVSIAGSEIIGLLPLAALVDTAAYYLGIEKLPEQQILERHLME